MNKRLSMVGIALLVIAIIYSACAGPAPAPAATPAATEAAPAAAATTATEAAPAAAAPATTEAAAAAPAAQAGSRLDIVKSRGKLICGVNNQVPGFGNVDADGNYAGFDVDFCKAVAAAVLGDANAVEYKVCQLERPLHDGEDRRDRRALPQLHQHADARQRRGRHGVDANQLL